MPDSYQAPDELTEQAVPAVTQRKRPSIFRDPVVRGLSVFAVLLVVLYVATVLGALLMGVLNPVEPRTRVERDIRYYEKLTQANPKDTVQWKAYINALMASKQYLKAQDVIDRARKAVDEKSTMNISMAQAELYLEQKKYKEAVSTCDQIRKKLKAYHDKQKKVPGTPEAKGQEISDSYYFALIVKSTAQEQLGDKKAAIKSLDAYVKDNPTAADVLVKRGLLRAEAGDKKGAEKDFRTALKYIPNDSAALSGLEKIGVKQ